MFLMEIDRYRHTEYNQLLSNIQNKPIKRLLDTISDIKRNKKQKIDNGYQQQLNFTTNPKAYFERKYLVFIMALCHATNNRISMCAINSFKREIVPEWTKRNEYNLLKAVPYCVVREHVREENNKCVYFLKFHPVNRLSKFYEADFFCFCYGSR